MTTKLLLIAIAFAAAFWLLRHRRGRADRDPQPPSGPQAVDMVGCAHCGLHLPRGDGISAGRIFFCCEEHEREFRSKNPDGC